MVTTGNTAEAQRLILLALLEDAPHGLSTTELRRLLPAPRHTNTVNQRLRELRAAGKVESYGTGRSRFHKLAATRPPKTRLEP